MKSYVTSLIALVVGLLLAWFGGFQVLGPLGLDVPRWVEAVVTGLIISGGTEGLNSLLKFMGYAKENQKDKAKTRAKEAVADAGKSPDEQKKAMEAIDAMHH